jgi:hypothetical protein
MLQTFCHSEMQLPVGTVSFTSLFSAAQLLFFSMTGKQFLNTKDNHY